MHYSSCKCWIKWNYQNITCWCIDESVSQDITKCKWGILQMKMKWKMIGHIKLGLNLKAMPHHIDGYDAMN